MPSVYAWPGVEGELTPGETMTATATYTLTAADITAKKLTNNASLRGLTGVLAEVSAEASVTLDAPPEPVASGLASTGVNGLVLATIGSLLLGAGLLFHVVSTRRKRDQPLDA